MVDLTAPRPLDDPADDGPAPAMASTSPSTVLIDYIPTVPAHAAAPVVAMIDGCPPLMLSAGINPVDADAWVFYREHAGIAAMMTGLAGPIVENVTVPRDYEPLLEVIGRTWSAAGLDAIEAAEIDFMGGKARKPRKFAAEALKQQRARVAKRTKAVRG